jgi:hypothetical protein
LMLVDITSSTGTRKARTPIFGQHQQTNASS